MAKSFSDHEKRLIVEKLRSGAVDCVRRYGIRKTSVDELTKIAGISKGAFYLFYPSKEILFFEVIAMYQEKIQKELIQEIKGLSGGLDAATLSDILFRTLKKVNQSFLFSVMENNELEYLERKLPADVLAEHQMADQDIFKSACRLLFGVEETKAGLFSATFRAIVVTMFHKQSIGTTIYDEVLKTLLRGVVEQMLYPTKK